jgi:dolichol-phosphate mannosyltransferase
MIHVIILAYNEAPSLPKLLQQLNEVLRRQTESFRFLIVDDGSKDGTAAAIESLAKQFPVVLLQHEVNKGVAQVFNTGIRRAAADAAPEDIIITMEGDLTNDPESVPAILEKLRSGFEVVCASRYQQKGGYQGFPFKRYVLSRGANAMARLFFRIPGIKDYTLFFKGYKARALQKTIAVYGNLFIGCRGFASNAEILVKTVRLTSARCVEIPTVYRYDLKRGKSTMNLKKNLVEYLKLFLHTR